MDKQFAVFPLCGHYNGLTSKRNSILAILHADLQNTETLKHLKRLTLVFLRLCVYIHILDWCIKIIQFTDHNVLMSLISPRACHYILKKMLEKGSDTLSTLANVDSTNVDALRCSISATMECSEEEVIIPRMLLGFANSDTATALSYEALPCKMLRMCTYIKNPPPHFMQECSLGLLMSIGYIRVNETNCKLSITDDECRPISSLCKYHAAYTGKVLSDIGPDKETRNKILEVMCENRDF